MFPVPNLIDYGLLKELRSFIIHNETEELWLTPNGLSRKYLWKVISPGTCNKYQSNLQPRISIEEIAELENEQRAWNKESRAKEFQGQKVPKSKDDITKELHLSYGRP